MEDSSLQARIECLELFASKWTKVRENEAEEIHFPKIQTIHVGSLREAFNVMEHRGLHLVSKESIETYCASGSPEVNFPRATTGMMEVCSTARNDYDEGHLTYTSRRFWKIKVSSPDGTLKLCWYLAENAEKGSRGKNKTNERETFKAMSGTVKSNVLPEQNESHLQKKAGAAWKEERDIMRAALKKSPAYLRGKVVNPQKPGLPHKPEIPLPGHKQNVGGEREKKSSKYFSFVKRIVELKRIRRAAKKKLLSESAGISSQALAESQQV